MAVVVSFNGADSTLRTINKLLTQVDHVHIVDNASNQESIELLERLHNRADVSLAFLEENKGIGHALNLGVEKARQLGFAWLLTMDQDTIIHKHLIDEYRKVINDNPNVVCLAPSVNVYGKGEVFNRKRNNDSNKPYKVSYAITSGNLIKISLFDEITYNEELFIDCVDFDFALQARKRGYNIFLVPKAVIFHELGAESNVPAIFSSFYTTHSPLRRYYMFRNWCYIFKKYFKTYPAFILKSTIIHVMLLLMIPFFDQHPAVSIRYIYYGIKDFFKHKFGPLDLKRI